MTSEEEKSKHVSDKGFAGLMSMASNVDTIVTIVDKQKPDQTRGGIPPGSTPPPPQKPAAEEPKGKSEFYQGVSPRPSAITPTGKWLLGICAAIGVIWLLSSLNNPSSPVRSQQTPGQFTPTAAAPFNQFDGRANPPAEEVPPVGTDLVLGLAQIRYCLSEDIRIDAARAVLNNYLNSDIDRFNAMVDDYNSRCVAYRYRSGSLETARTLVERNRQTLEVEGRARFS